MSSLTGKPLRMKVWPKEAVFMDWFSKKCLNTWGQGLTDLYGLVPFDGIWIDMNEATGFTRTGEIVPPTPTSPVSAMEVNAESATLLKRFLQDTVGEESADRWFDSF